MGFYVPGDEGYQRAKALKQGRATLDPAFGRFVERFERRYGVAPLAIEPTATERAGGLGWPHLDITLERSAQLQAFRTGPDPDDGLGRTKQREIAGMLVDAMAGTSLRRLFGMPRNTPLSYPWRDEIYVVLSDFERTAKWEVHDLVTEDERERWVESLALGEAFWCTQRFLGPPRVFVHTDAQAAELTEAERQDAWGDGWFALAKAHDELGYLEREDVVIALDSRQSFEENHQGSWYDYFRA
ncbi:MAG: hypothetical protein FWD95_14560 [Nocardioidaceae bacterium]|nr:hypothetical protein [Nocardioidaceae bacterium]